jgi:transcriptional regulator with XRE-family HTH domain
MKKEKMTGAEWFQDLGERLKADGRLQIDQAKLELSEQVFQLMQDQGVTEAELARRLGASRAYVNKVLQGDTNFTIESLVKLGLALNCDLKLEFAATQEKGDFEADIKIIHEKPIEKPIVVSPAKESRLRNVLNFGEYKSARTFTVDNTTNEKTEKTNAGVEIAA